MKHTKFFPLFAALAISILVPLTLQAADPNGSWTSSSGSTVKLWANMQQVQVTVSNQTGSWKYRGWWTRFGDYFSYEVPGTGVYNCSFGNNSNIIYVKAPNGQSFTWTRGIRQQAPTYNNNYNNYGNQQQQYQQTSIDGIWLSNSGNAFSVSTRGNQVFVTIVKPNGSKIQGIGAWLIKGSKFSYSIQGYTGQAICTVQSPNIIYVNYNGQITTWNRR